MRQPVDLLPFRTPIWVPVGDVEVTAWPLTTPDDVFICGSALTARAYAEALGARLPTPQEEDLFWEHSVAYGVVIEPPTRTGPPWPSTEDQSMRLVAKLTGLGASFDTPVANTGKPWLDCEKISGQLVRAGRAVNYGWFVAASDCKNGNWKGIRTYQTLSGSSRWRVIQPLSSFHSEADTACGYETHIRLVRERP